MALSTNRAIWCARRLENRHDYDDSADVYGEPVTMSGPRHSSQNEDGKNRDWSETLADELTAVFLCPDGISKSTREWDTMAIYERGYWRGADDELPLATILRHR